ncbi:hypothetical protein Tco_0580923 [Tanacetum coccineum]
MANLIFADSHNMVAYLETSEDNADFAEIVDFLNASPIRRDLHFNDEDGITCLTSTEIFENLQLIGSKSTALNEFGTNIASAVICLAKKQKFNFSKLIFDAVFNDEYDTPSHIKMHVEGEGRQPTESQPHPTMLYIYVVQSLLLHHHHTPKQIQKHRKTKRKAIEISQSSRPTTLVADETVYEERGDNVERVSYAIVRCRLGSGSPRRQDTILGDRPAQTRFVRLSKQSNHPPLSGVNTPGTQDLEITNLKKRVKKMEKKKKSRTPQLKRRLFKDRIESSTEKSLGDQEDASKQGRNEINQDEGISWFQKDENTQGRYGHDISTAEVTTASVPSDVDVSTASLIRLVDDSIIDDITLAETLMKIKSSSSRSQKDKGVMFKEPSEPTTTSRPQSHIPPKDKGKGMMQEPEKPVKVKGKVQIEYDVDVAQRLQAELDEEDRLEREREKEASKAAKKGEISIEERSRLFVELMDKRKKHFAKLRAEEQRRKPQTKTQKRNIMSTYLKNMAGYKHTQLKNKSFEEIQIETREESGSKRAGDELEQESSKRQKVDDDKEREDLKQCFEIVPDEEFVVHAIPLAIKPAPIVGFQIHRAGRQGSYEIIRANGSTKTYTLFSQLIKEFGRQDLENLWKLVKTKHGYTRPEEAYKRVLWGGLKVMFEPDVEDNIWRNLKGQKILIWKLYDSCFVRFKNMHIYMLVEKRYPLSLTTITAMLKRKLQADYWNETCYQLLKLITKQLNNP